MASAREAILKALYDIEYNESYTNQALQKALTAQGLKPDDRGFVTEIVMGVMRNCMTLDHIIQQHSKLKLKKLSPWVHQILRMGVYQIGYMDHVPDSAACNESVKLAKRYAHGAAVGYVNGVLRTISREKSGLFLFDTEPKRVEECSTLYSCPLWLTQKLVEQFGLQEAAAILRDSLKPHQTTIRTNLLKTTSLELIDSLAKEGVMARQNRNIPECLHTTGALRIGESVCYQEGLYTLQNINSMRAACWLDPQPGELVVDACAAPGGKSTHMAERMKNQGRIISFDCHEHKIPLIRQAAKRLGIDVIEAVQHDSTRVCETLRDKADRVLVDAPCSGIGLIHQKPDIKWRRRPEDILELCRIQRKILDASAAYVRPGGVLLYATCTILDEENQRQVQEFIARHPAFVKQKEQLLLAHKTGGSGFYLCKFLRSC